MTFLNKGYYKNKTEVISNIKENHKKLNTSKEKASNLKEKLNILKSEYKETDRHFETKEESEKLLNHEKRLEVYINKLETIDKEIVELTKKIKEINTNYDNQIVDFENLISHLKIRINSGNKKYNIFENQMKIIKNDIKEKRKTLQNFLGNNEQFKGKENFMENFIKKTKKKLIETSNCDDKWNIAESNEFLRFSYKSNNYCTNEISKPNKFKGLTRESKSLNKIISNMKRNDCNNRYKRSSDVSEENLKEESFFEQKFHSDSFEKSKFSKTTNTRTNLNKITKSLSQVELKSDSLNKVNRFISSPQTKISHQLNKNNKGVSSQPNFDMYFKETKDSWNGIGKISYSSRSDLKSSLSKNNMIQSLNRVNYIQKRDKIIAEDILVIEKLRQLIKGVKCLIRFKNKNIKVKNEEFDPFISYQESDLIEKLKFTNAFITLDKSLKKLNFDKTNSSLSYKVNEIENIEVTKKIRDIINVMKFHQYSSSVRTDLINNYHVFDKHLLITQEYEQKCLSVKYFLLCLNSINKTKIEILFQDLNQFKSWAKNLEFLIKNQLQISLLQNKI